MRLATQTKTDPEVALRPAPDLPAGVVVPLFRGPSRDEHPYAAFAPGNLTKKELLEWLRSVRGPTSADWVERRMRHDGLPYHKVDPNRRQSAVRFSLPRVQAWLESYGHQVNG